MEHQLLREYQCRQERQAQREAERVAAEQDDALQELRDLVDLAAVYPDSLAAAVVQLLAAIERQCQGLEERAAALSPDTEPPLAAYVAEWHALTGVMLQRVGELREAAQSLEEALENAEMDADA